MTTQPAPWQQGLPEAKPEIKPAAIHSEEWIKPPEAKPIIIDTKPYEPELPSLTRLPSLIQTNQGIFDKADRAYQKRRAELTIQAFTRPMFPGKKDGEGLRPASNDTERDAAVQMVLLFDEQLDQLADRREMALRVLMGNKNAFEAAKITAQLEIAQTKKEN